LKKLDYSYAAPYVFGFFVGLGALILWYFSALAIDEKVITENDHYLIKLFITLIGTLSGSVVGASLAFRYNKIIEEGKEYSSLVGSLIQANMIMAGHIEHIATMLQHIAGSKGKSEIEYFFNLRNFHIPDYVQKQNLEGFKSILKEAPWLLGVYHDMESAVLEINEISKIKSETFEHYIKPMFYAQNMVSDSKAEGDFTTSELKKLTGERLFEDYILYSKMLISVTLTKAHEAIYCHNKLKNFLSERFETEEIPVYGDIDKIKQLVDAIRTRGVLHGLVEDVDRNVSAWS
tara:strand:+ start:8157 stop:9026 length:870 start_codon:yes stop_codon:yes gene_type:complete